MAHKNVFVVIVDSRPQISHLKYSSKMMNTGKLAGRTIFITGASRGIGKEIALKAARDGANIVIAAKTATAHPKLPGTIYTAAEEVEKAGGKAHPCVVDVRDETQVRQAVQEAVAKFGGIDILINNASAISLTSTLQTDMKRYDLMHNINTRGTFLVTKECLPYILKSDHGHVLNISPPLNMSEKWFAPHVAYTMAKFGMSMCVLGMAREFADQGVAFNTLWPRTAIFTAALQMLQGDESFNYSRKADIMADAAYTVLCKEPRNFTGQFLVDEKVLREAGITDFVQYACNPEYADQLVDDFFLEEKDIVGTSSTSGKAVGHHKTEELAGSGADASKVPMVFSKIETMLSPEIVSRTQAVYQFHILGEAKNGTWYLDLKNGSGSCGLGTPNSTPDATLSISAKDFVLMFGGQLKPAVAYISGQLKVSGDLPKALKLEKLMKALKSKL